MVKRDTEERVVDLTRYLPGFLAETEELSQAARAEECEVSRIYGKMDQVWDNGFIQTADLQGMKRWEVLLGIKPYPGDTLEERRAAVLSRWNQQLPYSLLRLKERLNAAVGASAYELDVRYNLYELELILTDQVLRVMQEVRGMTREMIPANLLFIFAGRYPVNVPMDIQLSNRLELQSDYHARYNRQYLVLDGTWLLDGTYKLNGYKELAEIDLYPLVFTVAGGCQVKPGISSIGTCRSNLNVPSETESTVKILDTATVAGETESSLDLQAEMAVELGEDSGLVFYSSVEKKATSRAGSGIRSYITVELDTVSETVAIKSEETVSVGVNNVSRTAGAADAKVRTTGKVSTVLECAVSMLNSASASCSTSCENEVFYEHHLKVERNLWYLDGTHLLDGSMQLNAEVINYEL